MHWILLRGLAREQAHWGDLPERLASAFPQHRFHAVDLPGTGICFGEKSPWSIPAIRQKVQYQVRSIPGPYGVIGLSMGAMVAMDWAQAIKADADGHDEIRQLILINTSSRFSPFWRRLRPQAWLKVLRLLTSEDVRDRESRVLTLTSGQPLDSTVLQRWCSIQRERPVSPFNAVRQLVAAVRYCPDKHPPSGRGLLLASAKDQLVDWRCSRTLAKRWKWSLTVHPDAGHDLPLDDPAWIMEQLAGLGPVTEQIGLTEPVPNGTVDRSSTTHRPSTRKESL